MVCRLCNPLEGVGHSDSSLTHADLQGAQALSGASIASEGTSIECATLELRSCGSEAVLSPWILPFMRSSSSARLAAIKGHHTARAKASACDASKALASTFR